MTTSTSGIVAAESPLAAQAGAVELARGGHAVDAAIAANAVMGLVAPMMNGVGGDLFAIVHDAASNSVHGLNASGWSPAGASIEFLTARGLSKMPQQGIHAVTVPGAVSGWMALHEKFGKATLETILSAAIAHADNGFPVSEVRRSTGLAASAVAQRRHAAPVLPDASARPVTSPHPDLARSRERYPPTEAIVYRGEVARPSRCSRILAAPSRGRSVRIPAEWVTP